MVPVILNLLSQATKLILVICPAVIASLTGLRVFVSFYNICLSVFHWLL